MAVEAAAAVGWSATASDGHVGGHGLTGAEDTAAAAAGSPSECKKNKKSTMSVLFIL
jgi:hypothetical protein